VRDILSRHAVDGTILWVSPAVDFVLGYPPDAPIGRFTELIHADERPAVQDALATVVAGRPATVAFRVRHAQGGWRWIESHAVPWTDSGGESFGVAEVHVISRDVTDRVEAERARREAEQRLALTLEHAPIGMAIVGLDGSFRRVNASLCRLIGCTNEELLATSFQAITHPDDLLVDLAFVQKLLAGEIEDFEMDKRYLRSDGSYVWAHLTVAVMRDDEGEPLHFVSQIQDISDQRRSDESLQGSLAELTALNQALHQANADKEQILAVVSHELRSPLTSILGSTDLLNTRWAELADERKRELLAAVQVQAQRLRELVEDLLTVSTLGSGELRLTPVDFTLLPLITRVVSVHAPKAQVTCAPEVSVMADPQRVEQILEHLLSNAVKYGAEPLQVVVASGAGYVDLTVIDEGVGVPPDFVPQLFERFTQASQGDRRVSRGAGLGLVIVRELAAAQGGQAWYSPNQPSGARFTVRLLAV
jgi:PAS domain S-box-containing protein